MLVNGTKGKYMKNFCLFIAYYIECRILTYGGEYVEYTNWRKNQRATRSTKLY